MGEVYHAYKLLFVDTVNLITINIIIFHSLTTDAVVSRVNLNVVLQDSRHLFIYLHSYADDLDCKTLK